MKFLQSTKLIPFFLIGAIFIGCSQNPATTTTTPSAQTTTEKNTTPGSDTSSTETDDASEGMVSFSMSGILFYGPNGFENREDVGANSGATNKFSIPNKNKADEIVFTMIQSDVEDELEGSITDDKEIVTYYQGTYLATTEMGSAVTRIFGEDAKDQITVEGNKTTTSIPRPSVVESYLVKFPSGKKAYFGFKYDESYAQAEKIIKLVVESAEEL